MMHRNINLIHASYTFLLDNQEIVTDFIQQLFEVTSS